MYFPLVTIMEELSFNERLNELELIFFFKKHNGEKKDSESKPSELKKQTFDPFIAFQK